MGATPSVDVFARDLEEALDPESGIEEEYMPYHDAVPTACSLGVQLAPAAPAAVAEDGAVLQPAGQASACELDRDVLRADEAS